MSEESPKYRIVERNIGWSSVSESIKEYLEQINTLAEVNYRVHTYTINFCLMSLNSPSKYENITNLKDVPPHEVDNYLKAGWVITDTYSKYVRMVRPLKQTTRNEE